jgi:MFS transporter, YNFM family, putative membrane transport protein
MSGLMLGAAAMFATMYATQAILPELAREFDVSPAQAGLTVSVVVLALAVGGWLWGPLSDRYGRKRSLMLASGLLVVPSLAAAVAPSFGWLVVCRALQGACMPGLLTVGVPYVAEVFSPAIGGRAMGYYTVALVAGGVLGRVGVGLVTAAAGWRLGLALVALLPAAGVLVMRHRLPEAPEPQRSARRRTAIARQLRSPRVLAPAIAGSTLFFTLTGVFSFVTFRLQRPPFDFGPATTSLVFVLWTLGIAGPFAGRLADRIGWRRVAQAGLAMTLGGLALTLADRPWILIPALALVTFGMFGGVTAAQLGLADAGRADRGVASAIYFSCYYGAGALAAVLPGLAWQEWAWPGVVAVTASALLAGTVALQVTR